MKLLLFLIFSFSSFSQESAPGIFLTTGDILVDYGWEQLKPKSQVWKRGTTAPPSTVFYYTIREKQVLEDKIKRMRAEIKNLRARVVNYARSEQSFRSVVSDIEAKHLAETNKLNNYVEKCDMLLNSASNYVNSKKQGNSGGGFLKGVGSTITQGLIFKGLCK